MNRRNRWLSCIRNFLYRRNRRTDDLLNRRVTGAKKLLGLFLLNLGVTLVGIIALADSFQDTRGVPFGKLDLFEDIGFGGAPFVSEVEECGGCVKRICCLSARKLA